MLRKISLYACAVVMLVGCQCDNTKKSSDQTYTWMCTIRSPYTMYYVPKDGIFFGRSYISFDVDNGEKRVMLSNYSMECVKVTEGEEK